jgi:hypothetical protein
MVKGLKQTSEIIAISTSVTESAANTLTSETIELSLSPLDNQIFVVTKVDADLQSPDLIAGTAADVRVTLSSVARTTIGNLSDNDCIAVFGRNTEGAAGLTTSITTHDAHPDQASPGMEYLAIVFTNDMFLNIQGTNNAGAKTTNARIWGYRATATSSVYAAGVQAELLG